MIKLSPRLAALCAAGSLVACADTALDTAYNRAQPTFATIDVHNHTYLTDGSHLESDVLAHALGEYQLDMLANSEHGGAFGRDTAGAPWAATAPKGDTADARNAPTRDGYTGNLADAPLTLAGTNMWRWQVLRDYSWPLLFNKTDGLALQYPKQVVIQAVEWNAPTHEHVSVGIVGTTSGRAISDFEYQFDQSDKDASRSSGTLTTFSNTTGATAPVTTSAPPEMDLFGNALTKKIKTHMDAVAGAAYLQKNFKDTSYAVVNHPSRKQKYSAADFRDLMIAGPDVVVGLEGFPGHQKELCRGGYGTAAYRNADGSIDEVKTARLRTYGGADWMLGKVGGLMDSLWAEGRRFWVFVNSDFHSYASDADFWPGQYAKTYVGVASRSGGDIVKGMKAGNVFAVQGDLVNALDLRVVGRIADGTPVSAFMGETVDMAKSQDVTVSIRFRSPAQNAHGDVPVVDHLDVIAGSLGSKSVPGDSGYGKETSDAAVMATVHKSAFARDGEWLTASVTVKLDKSKYVRIRGTNHAIPSGDGDPDIDAAGHPKMDDAFDPAACSNSEAKAWADLWFYSNPIFVNAK